MTRRIDELGRRGDVESMEAALQIGKSLREWDRPRAAPALSRLVELTRQKVGSPPNAAWTVLRARLGVELAKLAEDEELELLAAELETTDPRPLLGEKLDLLYALVEAHENQGIEKLLAAWFSGPLAEPPLSTNFNILMTLATSNLDSPALKAHALSMLSRRERIGSASSDGTAVTLVLPDGESKSWRQDLHLPADAREVPLRIGDLYAFELAGVKGAPEFPIVGSVAERDRAIRKLMAWLAKYRPVSY